MLKGRRSAPEPLNGSAGDMQTVSVNQLHFSDLKKGRKQISGCSLSL